MVEVNRTSGPDVYDKWVELEVHIKVPNFSGVIRWSALQKELLTLASDLERLNSEVGHEHTVHFTSTEPGLTLRLHMNTRGQIDATYRFSDSSAGPGGPELSGSCTLDQTYLAPMAASLAALAQAS